MGRQARSRYRYLMLMNIIPLDSGIAAEMRDGDRDAYSNPLQPEIQHQYGNPCRHCLRRAHPGESLVLFSYSPFERQTPYKEVGPVFVHADGCERYANAGELPEDFLNRPIVLRAYDDEQRIATVAVVVDGSTKSRAEQLLADPSIAYLHARSFTHGCYLFRIERGAM
jgi:Protein of unknown function (DUF1203)